jgi:hypothetical protein
MRDPYRKLIARLPIPTVEQTENFAAYMVGAHSWYKHLPCHPPGAPFSFFLDPNAGRSVVMLTTEYRDRFGHWPAKAAVHRSVGATQARYSGVRAVAR